MAHAHLSNLNLKYFTQKMFSAFIRELQYVSAFFLKSAYSWVVNTKHTK